jgi:hypothetical protein
MSDKSTTDDRANAGAQPPAFAPRTGSGIVLIGEPYPVPPEVCVCPNCGGKLTFQLVADEDDFGGLTTDCENEPPIDSDEEDETHTYLFSDWEPVHRKVRAWLRKTYSQNNEPRNLGPTAPASGDKTS